MKLLTLLLIFITYSFSTNAQVKVEVENLKNGRQYAAKFKTNGQAQAWTRKQKDERSFGKKVTKWEEVECEELKCLEGFIKHVTAAEYETDENLAIVHDDNGDPIIIKPQEITFEKAATAKFVDISAEVQAEETKKQEIKALKDKLKSGQDLNIKEINTIIRNRF